MGKPGGRRRFCLPPFGNPNQNKQLLRENRRQQEPRLYFQDGVDSRDYLANLIVTAVTIPHTQLKNSTTAGV